jgi:hypothetical protein
MARTVSLLLSAQHSADLQGVIEDRGRPVKHVQRAQVILLSAERRRLPSGSASAGRWCGAGSSASPRKALRACCATRPARPASRQCHRPRCMPWSSTPCANRPVQSPIGPAAPWPRPWVFRCERSSAYGLSISSSRTGSGPSSDPGDIVIDPFLGSGSTLIAADCTGRVCRGVELDPLYIDVVVCRYEAVTGCPAVLVETGETFEDLEQRRARERASGTFLETEN